MQIETNNYCFWSEFPSKWVFSNDSSFPRYHEMKTLDSITPYKDLLEQREVIGFTDIMRFFISRFENNCQPSFVKSLASFSPVSV